MLEEITPPSAPSSELFVLSAFTRDPGLLERHRLDLEAFTRSDLRAVYGAMVATGKTDVLIVGQHLADAGLIGSVVPPVVLNELCTAAINHELHLPHHLGVVLDRHRRRKVIDASRRTIEAACDCTVDSFTEAIPAIVEAGTGPATQGDGFPLRGISEMDEGEPAFDFVEGLLTEGGASVVYGESNVGKSFFVLDLAAHVAMGRAWRYEDRAVERGAVVYVALEGTQGLRRRIEAMTSAGILTAEAPLYVVTSPVSLLDPTHGLKLAATVRAAADRSDLPCRLVVIDTMARAMAGGNENAGEDMTAAVAVIDEVKRTTGAHVAIVHHAGKDAAKGARGHSSLRAAVDTEIELFRPEGERITTARVTKQRDIEPCEPMPFSLRVIELGADRRGKPVTSCVVKHEDEVMASQPKKAGRKAVYSADAMLEYLPAASVSEWATRAKEECGVSNGKFYELKAELQHRKAYRAEAVTGRLVRA